MNLRHRIYFYLIQLLATFLKGNKNTEEVTKLLQVVDIFTYEYVLAPVMRPERALHTGLLRY